MDPIVEIFQFALCSRCKAIYIMACSSKHHGLIAVCGAVVDSAENTSEGSYTTYVCAGKIRSIDPRRPTNHKTLRSIAESLHLELEQL